VSYVPQRWTKITEEALTTKSSGITVKPSSASDWQQYPQSRLALSDAQYHVKIGSNATGLMTKYKCQDQDKV